jgi:O-antigen/teichoic acid export membrane protein
MNDRDRHSSGAQLAMIRSFARALAQKLPVVILYIGATSSLMVGIATQSIGFVILARFLGKAQFGQLATITALGSLGAAWVQLGSSEAMRRRVGRDPSEYGVVLGHSLILIFGWGGVVTILFAGITSLLIHISTDHFTNFIIMLMFVVCNLVFYSWITLTEQIFLAHGDFTRGNLINAGFGVVRASAALAACVGFGVQSLATWAVWNASAYLGGSLLCALAVSKFGRPRGSILRDELPIGVTFGISGFLSALRGNVDLLALSVAEPAAVVGVYGLARRVVAVAAVTGASLDRIVYTRLVIAGQGGPRKTFELARRYVVYAVILTGATSLALFLVVAAFLPLIFGSHFSEAIGVLRILCWILIFTGVQNIAFDALNAANLHRPQAAISTVAVLIGSAIVLALTLIYGIEGTYVGVYLSELLIAIALWSGLVLISYRRESAIEPFAPSMTKPGGPDAI